MHESETTRGLEAQVGALLRYQASEGRKGCKNYPTKPATPKLSNGRQCSSEPVQASSASAPSRSFARHRWAPRPRKKAQQRKGLEILGLYGP